MMCPFPDIGKGLALSMDSSASLRFIPIGRTGDVPEGQGRPFEVEGRTIAVFRDDGAYYALDDACPHQGIPLSDGFVHDRTVTCSWHGWVFRLTDGCWLNGSGTRADAYPVRVVDDRIEVGLPTLSEPGV